MAPRIPRHPILRRLALRIRELREQAGLSQEALADKAGIDRSYMSSIERGLRNVGILTLHRLSKALGRPVRAFFEAE